jgi:hypothetical protein
MASSATEDPALASFLTKHARDVNSLADGDRNKRRRAIQTLTGALTGDERTASPALPVEVIRSVMDSSLAKPIIALIADSSEGNREAAIQLVTKVLHEDHSKGKRLHASMLPLLVPAIIGRIGKYPFAEDSEELRLQLAQLLNVLLQAGEDNDACKGMVRLHLKDLVDLLKAMSHDAFPAVKSEISTSVLHLVSVAAPSELSFLVGPLVTAFAPSLSHQRAAVRLSMLEAISALVCVCNSDNEGSGGEGLERLFNEVLLPVLKLHVRFDRMPSVRKQLAVSLGQWLSVLPWNVVGGKIEGTCLAMLLSLTADEAPEVGAQACSSLEAAADARANKGNKEGGKSAGASAGASSSSSVPRDLSIAADAASIDSVAAMSVAGGGILRSEEDAEGQDDAVEEEESVAISASFAVDTHLPHGGKRASPSVVRFVGKRLHNTLPIVLDELKDWTGKTRIFSAGGLRALLACAESFVTPHLSAIIASLCTGSRDEEAEVRRLLNQAGGLLGSFVPAEEQLAVLLPQLRGDVSGLNNAQHYTAALKVLAAAVGGGARGSGTGRSTSQQPMSSAAILPHLQPIVSALASPRLVEEEAPGLRRALASAISAVLGAVLQGDPSADSSASMAVDSEGGSSSGGASTVFEASVEVKKPHGGFDRRGRLVRAMSRAMIFDDEEDLTGSSSAMGSFSSSSASTSTTPGGYFSPAGIAGITDEVRRALSDKNVLEPLLLLLLYLHESTTSASAASSLSSADSALIAAAEDVVICMASDCVHALARALKFRHSADLYAAFSQRLLAIILADCNAWAVRANAGAAPGTLGSATAVYHRRLFDTILRAARPSLSATSWDECRSCVESCVDAFAMCLSPSKDAELRVVTLALLDAFIIGASDPDYDVTVEGTEANASHTKAGARTAFMLSGEATTSAAARDHTLSPEAGGSGGAVSSSAFSASALHHHHIHGGVGAAPVETVPAGLATQHHVKEALGRMDVAPPSSSSSSSSSASVASAIAASVKAEADRSALMAVDGDGDDDDSGAALPPSVAALINSGHASDLAVDLALRKGAASRLVKEALLPNIIWRAGGVSSTIRKVSVACFFSMCRRGLLSSSSLREILPEVLPILKGCLSDDDPATRLLCTQSISCVLRVLKNRFDGESLRLLYVELLKRLDDSNDAVRIAACDCLRDLARAVIDPSDVRHGPTEHCVDALLVHCDDTDPRVQTAAYDATVSWGKLQPEYLKKQALAAKDKHRDPSRAKSLVAAAETFIAAEQEDGGSRAAAKQ